MASNVIAELLIFFYKLDKYDACIMTKLAYENCNVNPNFPVEFQFCIYTVII